MFTLRCVLCGKAFKSKSENELEFMVENHNCSYRRTSEKKVVKNYKNLFTNNK